MWIERMIGDLAVTAEVSMTNLGEPENFVPFPKTNTGPKEGLTEDEFAYDGLAAKTNIVVKIEYSRTDSAAVAAIKKISGVLKLMLKRKLLPDGTYGPLEDVFGGPTPEQQITTLEILNNALMLTVVDMYEENAEVKELNRNVMLMIVDLYEKVYAEEGVTE